MGHVKDHDGGGDPHPGAQPPSPSANDGFPATATLGHDGVSAGRPRQLQFKLNKEKEDLLSSDMRASTKKVYMSRVNFVIKYWKGG